jgi:beta-phosphoglucomutase
MPDTRLAAVILDFDGVILDSEPTHLAGFQAVLARAGRTLTKEDYYARYLGFDDRQAFRHMAGDLGLALDEPTLQRWVADKSRIVLKVLREDPRTLPGVVRFVTAIAESGVALAVASGALHAEVRAGLDAVGILPHVRVIVGADDTVRSKPAPDPYLAAIAALGIAASRGVAIEDSPAGIVSARAAGLLAVAVTNTYAAPELAEADVIVDSLERLTTTSLEQALARHFPN